MILIISSSNLNSWYNYIIMYHVIQNISRNVLNKAHDKCQSNPL